MKQSDIDKKTQQILALNNEPEKLHEFLCACANAKSMIENKLTAEAMKATIAISMKNLMNNIGKI